MAWRRVDKETLPNYPTLQAVRQPVPLIRGARALPHTPAELTPRRNGKLPQGPIRIVTAAGGTKSTIVHFCAIQAGVILIQEH